MFYSIRRFTAGLVLALCAGLSGCGGARAKPVDLPPPMQMTTLGVGDVFELYIVGEEKLPKMFTVASDGTADLPYVKRLKVAGLEPQELVDLVRKKLMEGEILTNPDVSVQVKEYNSKRVEVQGQVQKPGSLPLQSGMTLLRAISLAGGFNSIADEDEITIRRKLKSGAKTVTVSVKAILKNEIPDVPLQSDDYIYVNQRIF